MKKLGFAGIAAAAVLAFGASASAATVDFSEFTPNTFYSSPLVTKEGFLITNSGGFRAPLAIFDADPVNTAIGTDFPGSVTTVSLLNGGSFDVLSIALADRLDIGVGGLVDFTFSNSVSFTRLVDFSDGLQTIALGQTGIEWFSFRPRVTGPLLGFVQFDNIVVDNIASAVPEPATWATMILGFFGLGAMMRRSRRKLALAAG